MNCSNHPTKEAQVICVNCGKPFCSDCIINVDQKNYCKECIKKKLENNRTNITSPNFMQQQQQQSDSIPKLDLGNVKLGAFALLLFFIAVFLITFSMNAYQQNIWLGILGVFLLIGSLILGLIYAAGMLEEKKPK